MKNELYNQNIERERRGNAVELGINSALNHIISRYERSENPFNNLPYHDSLHTRTVISRTVRILSALHAMNPEYVEKQDIEIGRIAAGFHDVVQNWSAQEIVSGDLHVLRRVRDIGNNEKKSAEEAVSFMVNRNNEEGEELFSAQDVLHVTEAIHATIPDFDVKLGTVIQPGLHNDSSPVARALAMADIGTAGIDSPEAFVQDGVKLFREDNLDVLDSLITGKAGSLGNSLRERMLHWSEKQIEFARGRQIAFETEIEGFPLEFRQSLRWLFDGFDNSIYHAGKVFKHRGRMTLQEMLIEFGYLE